MSTNRCTYCILYKLQEICPNISSHLQKLVLITVWPNRNQESSENPDSWPGVQSRVFLLPGCPLFSWLTSASSFKEPSLCIHLCFQTAITCNMAKDLILSYALNNTNVRNKNLCTRTLQICIHPTLKKNDTWYNICTHNIHILRYINNTDTLLYKHIHGLPFSDIKHYTK